jgi:hypothetical protein
MQCCDALPIVITRLERQVPFLSSALFIHMSCRQNDYIVRFAKKKKRKKKKEAYETDIMYAPCSQSGLQSTASPLDLDRCHVFVDPETVQTMSYIYCQLGEHTVSLVEYLGEVATSVGCEFCPKC